MTIKGLIIVIVAITACSFLCGSAELRTFAYRDVLSSVPNTKSGLTNAHGSVRATAGTPAIPGILFQLPRTKIRVDLILGVDEETIKEIIRDPQNEKDPGKTNVLWRTYRVVPVNTNQTVLETRLEDDPELSFYLYAKKGFFTDTKEGKVQFVEQSSRISQAGVKYEDKTAEAISATVKLAAEAASIILGTGGGLVAKSVLTNRVVEHNIVEGIQRRFVYETYVRASGTQNPEQVNILFNLEPVQAALLTDLNTRLKSLQLRQAGSEPPGDAPEGYPAKTWNSLSGALKIEASQPIRNISASDVMLAADQTASVSGKRAGYLSGIPYRVPSPATVTLILQNQELAQAKIRLPEAGLIGWVEFRSKMFSSVAPGVQFDGDGGLKQVDFATSSQSQKVTEMLQNSKEALAKLEQDVGAASKADADARAKAIQDAANLEYKKETLKATIDNLKEQIKILETKRAAAKPDERDVLDQNLLEKRQALRLAEARLLWLEKGIEIKE